MAGIDGLLTATTTAANGTISSVTFSSSDAGVATATSPDAASPYTSNIRGVSAGSATITAQGIMAGSSRCTDTTTVSVTAPQAWWQAKDGDVSAQGNLVSLIPNSCTGACLARLILDGDGGYPGVAAYNGTSYDFASGADQGSASSKGWLANAGYGGRTYSFGYFASLIPSTVTINTVASDTILGADLASGGVASGDYIWYKRVGDLTINGDLTIAGTRRVVLLVSGGNLTLNGNITIATPGSGFFGTFVGEDATGGKGSISVGSTVTALSGIYWSDNNFTTGTGSVQLVVTGAVGGAGITLQRDLGGGNSTTPAEYFVYDPTLSFTFPKELALDRIVWREVSP